MILIYVFIFNKYCIQNIYLLQYTVSYILLTKNYYAKNINMSVNILNNFIVIKINIFPRSLLCV